MRVLEFAAPVDFEESLRPGAKIPIYTPTRAGIDVVNRLGAYWAGREGATCPTEPEIWATIDHVLRDATPEERARLDIAQAGMILLASVGQVREVEAMMTAWRAAQGDAPPDPPVATPVAEPTSPTPPLTMTPSES